LQQAFTTVVTHMPYGITQCYLPPARGHYPSQLKLVLDLAILDGCKAELTYLASYTPSW